MSDRDFKEALAAMTRALPIPVGDEINVEVLYGHATEACSSIHVLTSILTGGFKEFPSPFDFLDGEPSITDCRKMLVAFMRRSLNLLEGGK